MNKQHNATLNYPIEFMYNKDLYIAVEELPTEVAINVNGLGWNLLRNNLGIKTSPLLIPLDNPSEIKSLSAMAIPSLISDQIDEFQLNYVLTDTLRLNIDERSTRVFRVDVDSLRVPLREGHRISSPIRISPDSIFYEGPKKYLENLKDTIRLLLSEDAIGQTYNENVSIPVPEKVTSVYPPIVQVAFNVDEYVEEEIQVPLKLLRKSGENTDTLETGRNIRVMYTVQKDRAEQVNEEDFTIIGDWQVRGSDSTIIPRLTYYPLGLIDLRYDSSELKFRQNE
jgi:hypothetical protein